MVDYLNFVKNAGMGAFWEGQNQQDKLNASAVQQMLQQAQAEASRGAEARNQAMHPLEMVSKKLGNQEIQGRIAKGEFDLSKSKQEQQKAAADNFFAYLTANPDDIQGAVLYSGVPPQFAERFQQLPQEAVDLIMKAREDRMSRGPATAAGAKKKAEASAEQPFALERLKAQGANQLAVQNAMTDRALRLQRMKEDAAAAVRQRLQNSPKKPLDALLFEEIDLTKKISSLPQGEQQNMLREQLSIVRTLIDNARAGAQQERTPLQPGIQGMPAPQATPVQRLPVPGVDTGQGAGQGGRVVNFGDLK